ncbi:uncharacterized protein ACWYII_028736 [Salvelinus alpinus]
MANTSLGSLHAMSNGNNCRQKRATCLRSQCTSKPTLLLSPKMSVFVDSCFVTTSKDPNATPRLEVIHNFGCMVDSKRKGSQSQFFSRVKCSAVDALWMLSCFPQITAKRLYLHCTMTVMKFTSKRSAKSCTYNRAVGRWEELYGPPSVCSCCDSVCDVSEFWPALKYPSVKSLITSKPWRVLEDREKSLPIRAEERQPDSEKRVEETLAVTYRVEKVKFKSLSVAPWEEEKNMSVAVMNKVEEVQEGTVIGEEGVVARKEEGVEEPIEDKQAEKEMIEVAARELVLGNLLSTRQAPCTPAETLPLRPPKASVQPPLSQPLTLLSQQPAP